MKIPRISPDIIFADSAKLAALISCARARPGEYLPVCEGPRLQRPDAAEEIVRRNNAAARAQSRSAYFAGLDSEACAALRTGLNKRRAVSTHVIRESSDIAELPIKRSRNRQAEPLSWGTTHVGIGVLKALRAGTTIRFTDGPSPVEHVLPDHGHLVVCESGEEVAQVIAANYAYALGAGLTIIPEIESNYADELLERFYSLHDRNFDPKIARQELREQLSALCGDLPVPAGGSITFIGKLPFGFAFPSYPTTHLPVYPDLGIAIINGFAAEQPATHGTGVAVLVNPGKAPAPEIRSAAQSLSSRRAFVRVYEGAGATVRRVGEMIAHFPYDLLVIATHCGDSSGYRWTYEFTDSEKYHRTLVVDLAVGFGRTDDPNKVNVSEFMRFVSLDGVDWNDAEAKKKLYVGTAIEDFCTRIRSEVSELKPVKRETVPRVIGSSALMMHDDNLIVFYQAIADAGTPIVFSNACLSWHRLADDLIFAGARSYVGTLFPITSSEASAIADRLFEKHWGKPLPVAVWLAQRDVYGTDNRRPYVVSGIFPQRLRVKHVDYPRKIKERLTRSLATWAHILQNSSRSDAKQAERTRAIVKIYRDELAHFQREYP